LLMTFAVCVLAGGCSPRGQSVYAPAQAPPPSTTNAVPTSPPPPPASAEPVPDAPVTPEPQDAAVSTQPGPIQQPDQSAPTPPDTIPEQQFIRLSARLAVAAIQYYGRSDFDELSDALLDYLLEEEGISRQAFEATTDAIARDPERQERVQAAIEEFFDRMTTPQMHVVPIAPGERKTAPPAEEPHRLVPLDEDGPATGR